MWSLLWLAWCWFVTLSRSVDARCGQLRFRLHALPVSVGVPMLLAALLADLGNAGPWFPLPVPLRCLMVLGTSLFRSYALLVSAGVSMLLAALLLTDFGVIGLWFPFPIPSRCLLILANLIRPLAEVLSCSLLPLWLCLGGPFHPLPLPCSQAWHGAFPRLPWPCPVALSALTSCYGLARDWGMLGCLRKPLLSIHACHGWFTVRCTRGPLAVFSCA
ncbi:hypothetical protein V6N13_040289 [Hibiscus sabdariffa]|uniref:Uncharacterized protein n=1 Tax=Hibiscus sabdariffa TaxID=183260 RepID=A0ABR2C706_9ROSI